MQNKDNKPPNQNLLSKMSHSCGRTARDSKRGLSDCMARSKIKNLAEDKSITKQ